MRRKLSLPALVALGTGALLASVTRTAAAGDIPAQVVDRTVYLDSRALEELRATNPDHYARAQRVLAAENRCAIAAGCWLSSRDWECATGPALRRFSLPATRRNGASVFGWTARATSPPYTSPTIRRGVCRSDDSAKPQGASLG